MMLRNSESPVQDIFLDKMLDLSLRTQDTVCDEISRIDGEKFRQFEKVGAGENGKYNSLFKVCLLENSRLFEKASFVASNNWGTFTKQTEKTARDETSSTDFDFHAVGFSMVFHPSHPKIPSTRIHYHLIVRSDGYYWYSGGGDLTPYYIFPEDCVNFHQRHKEVCDQYLGGCWYQHFKKASDIYFDVKHRYHIRGIGGTFFDDLNEIGFGKKKDQQV